MASTFSYRRVTASLEMNFAPMNAFTHSYASAEPMMRAPNTMNSCRRAPPPGAKNKYHEHPRDPGNLVGRHAHPHADRRSESGARNSLFDRRPHFFSKVRIVVRLVACGNPEVHNFMAGLPVVANLLLQRKPRMVSTITSFTIHSFELGFRDRGQGSVIQIQESISPGFRRC